MNQIRLSKTESRFLTSIKRVYIRLGYIPKSKEVAAGFKRYSKSMAQRNFETLCDKGVFIRVKKGVYSFGKRPYKITIVNGIR